MTPTERASEIQILKAMDYTELAYWLCNNFTPDRYRLEQADVVKSACNMLFMVYNPHDSSQVTAEFIYRLWGCFGELPDEKYNFDTYGRLTTTVPNYEKPGVAKRVRQYVDRIERPNRERYRNMMV